MRFGRIGFHGNRDWRPYLQRGTDEWCNPSLCIAVPFIGAVDIFYGRRKPDRSTWWLSSACGSLIDKTFTASYISPDWELLAYVPLEHDPFDDDCPHGKTAEWIYVHSSKIMSLDDDEDEDA